MISRFTIRTIATILTVTFVAGVQAMSGQTAPQLLPYQTSVVAGGGAAHAAGDICSSGKTSSDSFGDGCLATEVILNAPKYVTEDSVGNIYFSDNGNALIRRVDAVTGIITAVAGGGLVALPSGSVCGSYTSQDFQGDGCLATAVKLSKPTGVAVSPLTGDLVFADVGNYTVRGISSKTGQIYNVAGYVAGVATYGYVVNTASTDINAATASALDAPYGIHFDSTGNLYIAEVSKDAVLVVNTSLNTTIVTGIKISPGTIAKITGFRATYGDYCPNGIYPAAAATYGCSYTPSFANGASAKSSAADAPYDVTSDAVGNVYFANEYAAAIGQISSGGLMDVYAGTQASAAVTNQRAPASSFPFGTPFGIASDSYGNIYIPDSVTGWIWRVDAVSNDMYVLAGAGPLCTSPKAAKADSYGDGCPASATIFPTGTLKPAAPATPTYASTAGISGLFVDASGTLLIGDTVGNLVHKITTNTNFGTILALPINPVQNIEIHFGLGDSGNSSSNYNLTTNSSNFSLGTPNCTVNSDTTADCILPVTANYGNTAGPFSSNLHVVSAKSLTGDFTLSGILSLDQAATNTAVKLSSSSTNPVTAVTITATATTTVSTTPAGTVTFFSNGAQIGTTQVLSANGTASIQYIFPVGTYSVSAVYGGSPYLLGSTSTSSTVSSVLPGFNIAWISPFSPSMTVAQGQYGVGSIAITTTGGYNGTVNFACSGLPANVSCSFAPSSLVVGGTGVTSNTITLNILTGATNKASLVKPIIPGVGYKMLLFGLLPGATGLLLFGVRGGKRTRLPAYVLLVGILLVAAGFSGCGYNQAKTTPTPAGTYNVVVTATGTPNVVSTSANIVQTSNLSLTVTGY